MKLGLDYRPALLGASGIGRYTRELCRAFASMPDCPEIELFAHSWKKSARRLDELGIRPPLRLHRKRIPSRAIRWANRLAGLTVESWIGAVDLFHFTDFVYPPLRKETPFIATIHDTAFLEPDFFPPATVAALRERTAWAVANARAILAPSTFAAGELVMRLGAKPGKVFITGLGYDHLPRVEAAETASPPYLLTVGTIEPRKNHQRILEAIERLHAKGFPHRWKIAGSKGWMTEPFFEKLAVSPSRDRVEILGDVDDAALARLYANATAVVYPSLYEGFGLPVAEALHAGAPLVTSAIASMPEVAGDAAIYVDPRDTDSIAEGIAAVIEDAAGAKTRREAGLARAARQRWTDTARATLRAYEAARAGNERPLARLF